MAALIHLDTHVVVWLFAGDVDRLSSVAQRHLEDAPLGISPMVALELTYLNEIGRLTETGPTIVEDLERRIGLQILATPFPLVIAEAQRLAWTRDPFDRIIAAQALAEKARLLSADDSLRERLDCVVW